MNVIFLDIDGVMNSNGLIKNFKRKCKSEKLSCGITQKTLLGSVLLTNSNKNGNIIKSKRKGYADRK